MTQKHLARIAKATKRYCPERCVVVWPDGSFDATFSQNDLTHCQYKGDMEWTKRVGCFTRPSTIREVSEHIAYRHPVDD